MKNGTGRLVAGLLEMSPASKQQSVFSAERPVPALEAFARRSRCHFIKHSRGRGSGRSGGPAKRQKKRKSAANKTRCESHLLFSQADLVCVQFDVVQRTVWVARTEAPRHLGCETGDVPSRNSTVLPLPLEVPVDWKNSPRIPGSEAPAIKSLSSWYASHSTSNCARSDTIVTDSV